MNFEGTIAAPATVPGSGAISIVRISGEKAIGIADGMVSLKKGSIAQTPGGRMRYGIIHRREDGQSTGEVLDEVVCCVYRAPHSYTGEDCVEIMCHASSYIVSTILEYCCADGATMALPGEFTRRAFTNGKMDLVQAEAVADIIASSTEASHRIAMNQLRGGVSERLKELHDKLLKMTALMELELDFSEEDVEFADRSQLTGLIDESISHIGSLAGSFRLGNAIKNGVPVAIIGETNAGKSTLLNAILGEDRAIVTDIAGTTRDTVEECFNCNGVLFRLIDTAGIRKSSDRVEKIGIQRSIDSIAKAEILIILLDAITLSDTSTNSPCESPAESLLSGEFFKTVLPLVDFASQKVIFALNKVDHKGILPDNIFVNIKNKIVSYIESQYGSSGKAVIKPSFVKISAKQGKGVSELLKILSDHEKTVLSRGESSNAVISNLRHYEALVKASDSLVTAREGLLSGSPSDLVAEDLRNAISILASITGTITTDDILGEIFSRFCIGK